VLTCVAHRHLMKFECVHPETIVGQFDDEPVFKRENVHLLHTADKWIQVGDALSHFADRASLRMGAHPWLASSH
jgi:hypothetical protein